MPLSLDRVFIQNPKNTFVLHGHHTQGDYGLGIWEYGGYGGNDSTFNADKGYGYVSMLRHWNSYHEDSRNPQIRLLRTTELCKGIFLR